MTTRHPVRDPNRGIAAFALPLVLLLGLALPATPAPAHDGRSHRTVIAHRAWRFDGGLWWTGETFEAKTAWSVDGRFRFRDPGPVDTVVNLAGAHVIPPLADAHRHELADGMDAAAQIDADFRLGIFYVKNPNNLARLTEPIRPLVNRPGSIDVAWSNGGLTATGGHPVQLYTAMAENGHVPGWTPAMMAGQAYFVVDTAADLDRLWPEIRAGHPDFLKVYLETSEQYTEHRDDPAWYGRRGLDPALLPAIVRRAHADSLTVAAHVRTAADFRNALAAGVDEITHLPLERITADDAARAARQKVVVVTTVLSHRPHDGIDDVMAVHRDNLARLREAGVRLAIGTDNNEVTARDEVEAIRTFALFDNRELLRIWTVDTPAAIFPARGLGRLEEGAEASFLALAGNPVDDFARVDQVALRFKQGNLVLLPDKPAEPRSIADGMAGWMRTEGLAAALERTRAAWRDERGAWNFAEAELNRLGYALLQHQQSEAALAVFRLNVEFYPSSPNARDSLGEACTAAGETAEARASYEKLLELLPGEHHYAPEFKKRLEANARARLDELPVAP